MHFEILIEDSSGTRLLEFLLPKLIGACGEPHTWRLHPYRGMSRIPKNLAHEPFPAHRDLLMQLPRLLRGYAKTPGYDAVIVVCDTDRWDCSDFLTELHTLARASNAEKITMFRLAIEETEAWYLGDWQALQAAYPKAKKRLYETYVQDSICDTWERLADIVHPGGSRAIESAGWPSAGNVKHQWANSIGPLMDPDRNRSLSFCKFRDGLRRLAEAANLNPSSS
jgi:hypothetical protein